MAITSERIEPGETTIETAAPRPEEMKAVFQLRLGDLASLRVTARATPAGILSAALFLAVFAGASARLLRARA